MTKTIPLTQGRFAIVDDDVYEWASKHKWFTQRSGRRFYACRRVGKQNAQTQLFLHREILNAPKGIMVDHINGDGLDCTRGNMRLASNAENQHNTPKRVNNTSGYKGVSFHRPNGKWRASLQLHGKQIHVGYFSAIEDAVIAYDQAALRYHGEFATTNL